MRFPFLPQVQALVWVGWRGHDYRFLALCSFPFTRPFSSSDLPLAAVAPSFRGNRLRSNRCATAHAHHAPKFGFQEPDIVPENIPLDEN
jgi:hypothetical protein